MLRCVAVSASLVCAAVLVVVLVSGLLCVVLRLVLLLVPLACTTVRALAFDVLRSDHRDSHHSSFSLAYKFGGWGNAMLTGSSTNNDDVGQYFE